MRAIARRTRRSRDQARSTGHFSIRADPAILIESGLSCNGIRATCLLRLIGVNGSRPVPTFARRPAPSSRRGKPALPGRRGEVVPDATVPIVAKSRFADREKYDSNPGGTAAGGRIDPATRSFRSTTEDARTGLGRFDHGSRRGPGHRAGTFAPAPSEIGPRSSPPRRPGRVGSGGGAGRWVRLAPGERALVAGARVRSEAGPGRIRRQTRLAVARPRPGSAPSLDSIGPTP